MSTVLVCVGHVHVACLSAVRMSEYLLSVCLLSLCLLSLCLLSLFLMTVVRVSAVRMPVAYPFSVVEMQNAPSILVPFVLFSLPHYMSLFFLL